MTLNSNETTWMATAVTFVYTSVQLWVVTKITIAKDKEEAKEDIKNKIVLLFIIISNIFAAYILSKELFGEGIVTRETLFKVSSSLFIVLTSMLYAVVRVMVMLSELQDSQLDYIEKVADTVYELKENQQPPKNKLIRKR